MKWECSAHRVIVFCSSNPLCMALPSMSWFLLVHNFKSKSFFKYSFSASLVWMWVTTWVVAHAFLVPMSFNPGFCIIDPVATIVAVVQKRVLTQKIFFERCWRLGVSIWSPLSLDLFNSVEELGSNNNFWVLIWRYFQNAGGCKRKTSYTTVSKAVMLVLTAILHLDFQSNRLF